MLKTPSKAILVY